MITLELLKTFCGDEMRLPIAEPWTDEGYTFASNGRLAVRVPIIAGVIGHSDHPKDLITNLRWDLIPLATFGAVPLSNDKQMPCECDCGHHHFFTKYGSTLIGNRIASGEYLAMLRTLPNCEIDLRVVGDTFLPFAFRFDGGDGLLMPMRAGA